ncbi:MAG: hypothetical protein DCF26_09330 [Burkholderiales bacterium]|nr:MAG: hypothetical protein DCF26_09330 [Burkholderiales bacterium]
MSFDALTLSQLAQLFPLVFAIAAEALDVLLLIPTVPRVFLLLWLLWVFYLAAMNLKRAKTAGTLSKVALGLGVTVMLVGYLLDVLANLVVFTVLLCELPKWGEWTVTARLGRHLRAPESGAWLVRYRRAVAHWFESDLLGDFDPDGSHL